jgi:acetyl esterase
MLTEQERGVLDVLAKTPMPKDIPGLRAMIDTAFEMMNANPPEIGALHENVELRPGLHADVAVPKGAGPHPVVVYLHGGGWVAGSPKSHRKLGMQFAEQGYLTINVDYRLAPEHRFPAGLDDCVFAIKWAGENAKRWNGDGTRMAVGGDSAGGNLSAASVAALAAENYKGARPKAALLIYGVFDFPAVLARFGKDPDASIGIEGMARAYLGDKYPAALDDPRVSPLKAVKSGAFPASFVICGTADPLVAEARAIAEALKRADIPHEVRIFEDMPHGFLQMGMLNDCNEGLRLMFDFLRRHV